MAEEKSFRPTRKRLEQARREGQVLKSSYCTQLFVIISVILTAWMLTPRIWVAFRMLLECCSAGSSHDPVVALTLAAKEAAIVIFIVGGVGGFAAMLSEGTQIGFKFEGALVALRADRLALNSGFKRIIGTGLKQSLTMLFRAAVLAAALCIALKQAFTIAMPATLGGAHGIWITTETLIRVLSAGIITSLFLCLLDYLLRRKSFFRDLSMSHQDLRDELRKEEGDPLVKAARRSLHESLALQDLVRRVRNSRVIVIEKKRHATRAIG